MERSPLPDGGVAPENLPRFFPVKRGFSPNLPRFHHIALTRALCYNVLDLRRSPREIHNLSTDCRSWVITQSLRHFFCRGLPLRASIHQTAPALPLFLNIYTMTWRKAPPEALSQGGSCALAAAQMGRLRHLGPLGRKSLSCMSHRSQASHIPSAFSDGLRANSGGRDAEGLAAPLPTAATAGTHMSSRKA